MVVGELLPVLAAILVLLSVVAGTTKFSFGTEFLNHEKRDEFESGFLRIRIFRILKNAFAKIFDNGFFQNH